MQNIRNNLTFNLDRVDLQLLGLLQTDASRSNQALAAAVQVSPPTALRRIRQMQASGLIERQVALLNPDVLAQVQGEGLTVLVEVSLDRQGQEALDAFERRALPLVCVQQCYRVSPGPDFVLVVHVPSMKDYQAFCTQLLSADANVRNVKAYFSTRRSKFDPSMALRLSPPASEPLTSV